MQNQQFQIADRFKPYQGLTIFDEIKKRIKSSNALNIANGFPDFNPPKFLMDSLAKIMQDQSLEHQYGDIRGHERLRKELGKKFSQELDQEIHPDKHILIGQGAAGILFNIIFTFLQENDEIAMFTPHFVQHDIPGFLSGCNVKYTPFISPSQSNNFQWEIDYGRFEQSLNEKTKMVIFTSPHNPTGKIFTLQEYQKLADILLKFPKIIIVSDEVYDFLIYDQHQFVRFGTLKALSDRTITVGSLGKSFSCTGWRTGFSIANETFTNNLISCLQYVHYTCFRPALIAFADALVIAQQPYKNYENYYKYSCAQFQEKRDFLLKNFPQSELNIKIFIPNGGYFIIMDIQNFTPQIPKKYFYENSQDNTSINQTFEQEYQSNINTPPIYSPDIAFVNFCIEELGLAFLPMSSFYNNQQISDITQKGGIYFVRVALCNKIYKYQQMIEKFTNLSNNLKLQQQQISKI